MRIIQSVEDSNPTVVPTESCPEAMEENDLSKVKKEHFTKGRYMFRWELSSPNQIIDF